MRTLAEVVEQASRLLHLHRNSTACPRLVELAARLRSGDNNAIISAISEATGGAGSLNDQTLCPATVDDQLREAIREIERLARSVACERGVALVR